MTLSICCDPLISENADQMNQISQKATADGVALGSTAFLFSVRAKQAGVYAVTYQKTAAPTPLSTTAETTPTTKTLVATGDGNVFPIWAGIALLALGLAVMALSRTLVTAGAFSRQRAHSRLPRKTRAGKDA